MKIITPFLLYIGFILLLSSLLTTGYICFILDTVDTYFMDVFYTSFYDSLPDMWTLFLYIIIQIVGLIVLNMIFASGTLWRLLRKV